MAKVASVSPSTVGRIWRAHRLKPHLVKTFKLSDDPSFVEKLEDVVGLYINPRPNMPWSFAPMRKIKSKPSTARSLWRICELHWRDGVRPSFYVRARKLRVPASTFNLPIELRFFRSWM